jgi:hypothetical protein
MDDETRGYRDGVAVAVLAALITCEGFVDVRNQVNAVKAAELATAAFDLADAMVYERTRRPKR